LAKGCSGEAAILFRAKIINLGDAVDNGRLVSSATRAWRYLRREVLDDPRLLSGFCRSHRKFEEFVAGAYQSAHWSDVVLTPRSHDRGYDVAAWKRGRQVLDEVKAY
jgi:hypothetical protein